MCIFKFYILYFILNGLHHCAMSARDYQCICGLKVKGLCIGSASEIRSELVVHLSEF